MKKAPCPLLACFIATALGQTFGQAAPARVTSVAECPLMDAPFEQFSGTTAARDFFIQLPEHISIQSGSELNLVLRYSPQFEATGVAVFINGHKILTTNMDVKPRAGTTNTAIPLRATVPPESLQAGWNRISLAWLSVPQATNREALPSTWSIWRTDSYLRVAYQKQPLFPELARFPASVAEEKLLRPGSPSSDASAAVIAILLPAQRRDVHLRSAAILGARLGQLGYLSDEDCRVGSLADWPRHASARNGIVVGRGDELSDLPLSTDVAASVAALKAGEGLLLEFITGNDPDQRRWMLATGRDDAGVEKALLTLGSAHALASAPPGPAIIDRDPMRPDSTLETATAPGRITGLHQVHRFLSRDRFLRTAAFLVPRNLSWEELQVLVNLSMYLGKQWPSSPILWPEACGFTNETPPAPGRLQGRSVLLLAPVSQWRAALPPRTRVAISNGETIQIQGRQFKFSALEPSLVLMQMLSSPWSSDETLVTAGGWKDFASPTLKIMLTQAAPNGRLYGNLAAMDAAGRTVAYDASQPSVESFAERIQRRMPPGLSSEETDRRLQEEQRHVRTSEYWNDRVFYFMGTLLLFFVALRLLLLWDRDRSRKRSTRGEKPLGSAT